ncbi:hypothetical protein A2U01_0060438, partial [Trifolium medium]|nr:hypothetical protein [Trifolium medium]
MAATLYEQHHRMDWGLPHFSPPLMAAVQDYMVQTLIPSYYQHYPQRPDLQGRFKRQTTRLLEHQTHVQDAWDRDYEAHHPQQDASGDELDRYIDEALYDSPPDQFFSAPGGS